SSPPPTRAGANVTKELSECAVLITGGTSGVGLATAHRIARAGATRIAVIGRNAERGKRACEALRRVAPKADVHFVPGDANDPAQATDAATAARDLLGGVD